MSGFVKRCRDHITTPSSLSSSQPPSSSSSSANMPLHPRTTNSDRHGRFDTNDVGQSRLHFGFVDGRRDGRGSGLCRWRRNNRHGRLCLQELDEIAREHSALAVQLALPPAFGALGGDHDDFIGAQRQLVRLLGIVIVDDLGLLWSTCTCAERQRHSQACMPATTTRDSHSDNHSETRAKRQNHRQDNVSCAHSFASCSTRVLLVNEGLRLPVGPPQSQGRRLQLDTWTRQLAAAVGVGECRIHTTRVVMMG
jgi:hypothetical protein